MQSQGNITFQEALDIIESLPEYQQEDIIEIIKKRLSDRRRNILAENIKEARIEYKRGEITKGNVEDLMRELSE